MDRPTTPPSSLARELGAAAVVAAIAVGLRLAWIALVPTTPLSDFANLVRFAEALAAGDRAAAATWWPHFNPGLPSLLALVLRITGGSPEAAARTATALLTGLTALAPLVIWRGVIGLRLRFFTSLLLALWPAQLAFSGVPAQDNWALPPMVVLGALAVRALRLPGEARPVGAALLWAASVWMRQELLVAALPLALAAGGLLGLDRRRALRFLLAAALGLGAVATQRGLATSRFALTTEHGGLAVLGSYAPGARGEWTFPGPFLASVDPSLLEASERQSRESYRLAAREALRRPAFHAARIVAESALRLTSSDALAWSLDSDGAASEATRARAAPVAALLRALDRPTQCALHAAFLAALLVGWRRRSAALGVLGASVAIKILVHAATVSLSRFYLPAAGLELLAIGLALDEALAHPAPGRDAMAAALSLVTVAAGLQVAAPLSAWVKRHDEDMRGARFVLVDAGARRRLECTVSAGFVELTMNGPRIDEYTSARLHAREPPSAPGAPARAALECRALDDQLPALELFRTPRQPRQPGLAAATVRFDDGEPRRWDLADAPDGGWQSLAVPPSRRLALSLDTPGLYWDWVAAGIRPAAPAR